MSLRKPQGHWTPYRYASRHHKALLLSLSLAQFGCVQAQLVERLGSIFVPGEYSSHKNLLVDKNKVLLSPLHIKHGSMKDFVKDIDNNGADFQHLYTLFPALSSA